EVVDPLSDSTRRALMHVMEASGDTPAALAAYRDYRALLREQMNVEPDAETVRLYQEIRQRARQPGVQVIKRSGIESPNSRTAEQPNTASLLPHPLTALIGREREKLEIGEAISRSRLVTLVGAGGIGKTRLAIEVARECAPEYNDGVAFVALASLNEP